MYKINGAGVGGFEIRGDNRLFFEQDPEIIVSGPAETGKTLAGLLKCHIAACAHPGAQITVVRKVFADLVGTVMRTYRRDIIHEVRLGESAAPVKPYGGERTEWYDYPRGSRLWFAGFDRLGSSLSAERDIVFVVQAEELGVAEWEYLTRVTTGRGAVMPYTQLIADCNPGSRSHWILERVKAGKVRFGVTTHKDNPTLWDGEKWTAQGERTRSRLGAMTGARRARLFEGIWQNPEGAIYEIFDRDTRHVCKAFTPPATWPRIVGVDPFGEAIAAVWLALDPHQMRWHVYREYSEPFGMTRQGHADNILALSEAETIFFYVGGGPSERQDRADYTGFGLPLLRPAESSVWAGVDRINALLSGDGLMIHDNCPGLISEFGEYRRKIDRRSGEPVESEIESKETFHLLDALRYSVIGPSPELLANVPVYDNAFQKIANLGY